MITCAVMERATSDATAELSRTGPGWVRGCCRAMAACLAGVVFGAVRVAG